jgi:Flp pilus assembly pilin Flp
MECFMTDYRSTVEYCRLLRGVLQSDRRGVTAVEYALVAGALVAGIAVAFTALTGNLKTYLGGLTFG